MTAWDPGNQLEPIAKHVTVGRLGLAMSRGHEPKPHEIMNKHASLFTSQATTETWATLPGFVWIMDCARKTHKPLALGFFFEACIVFLGSIGLRDAVLEKWWNVEMSFRDPCLLMISPAKIRVWWVWSGHWIPNHGTGLVYWESMPESSGCQGHRFLPVATHEMFFKTSPSHVLCLSLGWFWHCHVGFWGVWWDMVRYGSRMLLVIVFWSQLFAMIQLSLAFGGTPWLPGQEYGRNWSSLCGGLWDLEDVRGSTVHLQGRTKNMLMAKAEWHLIPLGRWRSMYGKLNW